MKKATVFGKYLLLERINVGGMAEVFIAKAFGVEGFERILAIKKILPTMAEDEEFMTMFIDEARISVQLSHANVVHIHDFGKQPQGFYIAMEYVAGRDLRTLLEYYRKQKEIMPTAQAVYVASKVAEGLDYAHRKKDARGQELGIIHRDVSPQNILISYEGEVKIIDFGIAKAANRSQKTQAGILKGKFGYMSPEQVRGLPIDRRSDVFALGVLLYEMLTGEKLFLGESDFSTLEKVRNAEVVAPSQFNPNIPPGLESVVLKALAREQEDRYQWASDLQEDLMRFLLAGDQIYSAKHLGGFMKQTFAEELLREEEKMQRYAAISQPEDMELSGLNGPQPGRPAPDEHPSDAGTALEIHPPTAEELAAMDAAADKTIVGDPPQLSAEGKTIVSGAPMMSEPSQSGPSLDGTEDTRASPRDRNVNRNKVVIGEGGEYAGATVIGPQPTSRGPKGGKPPSETVMLPMDRDEPSASVPPQRAGRTTPRPRVQTPVVSKATPKPRRSRIDDSLFRNVQVGPLAGLSTKARQWVLLGVGAALTLCLAGLVWVIALRSGSRSALLISVTPATAQVTVNGVAVAPGKVVAVTPGIYEVLAVAPGYLSRKQRVAVPDSPDPVQVTVELPPERDREPPRKVAPVAEAPRPPKPPEPAPEPVKVAEAKAKEPEEVRPKEPARAAPKSSGALFVTDQDGVEISIDGKRAGTTPGVALTDLKPGRKYTYAAKLSGYKLLTGQFEAPESGEIKVPLKLEREQPEPVRVSAREPKSPRTERREPAEAPTPVAPQPVEEKHAAKVATGMIACASEPAGAEVWVDGKKTGRTTPVSRAQPLALPVGKRKIFFKFNGKQSPTQTVEVTEAETLVVRGAIE